MAWHGLPRYTKDIDFYINPSPENALAIVNVLTEFGFASLGLSARDLQVPDQVNQLGREPHRIDLLTGLSGVDWAECWLTAQRGEMDGIPVYYLCPEKYIQNKLASGRPQDLADVARLREILSK